MTIMTDPILDTPVQKSITVQLFAARVEEIV